MVEILHLLLLSKFSHDDLIILTKIMICIDEDADHIFSRFDLIHYSGMAAIGAEVTQVSTNKMLRRRKFANVSISLPAVGDLDIGFSSAIGQFDVLVDTLSDEAKAGESMCIGVSNDWDDFSTDNGDECSSAVIMQLKSQHGCNRLVIKMH